MNKISLFFILIFSTIFLVVSTNNASAHLEAGTDSVVGNYIIDFGYSPKNPVVGQGIFLNFNLLKKSAAENTTDNNTEEIIPVVNFTNLWIRISLKNSDGTLGKTIFAGNLNPKNNNVNFLQTFAESGDYEIYVKFIDGEKTIAEYKYDFDVGKSSYFEGNNFNKFSAREYISVAILLFLIILIFLIGRKKKKL